MNLKEAITIGFAAVVVLALFVFVLMNRGSEKVITAVIPITVAAIVAIGLSIAIFGVEPAINEVFPTAFTYRADTKMPADLPWALSWRRFNSPLFAPSQLFQRDPKLLQDPDDATGSVLYHHLLQKSLVDWIGSLYRGSWQTELLSFEVPTGRQLRFQPSGATPEPSKILTTEEITTLLNGNKFAGINTGMPPQIALPPRAKLRITPPHREPNGLMTSEIRIQNLFCTVTIRTEESMSVRGAGSLARLAALSDAENQQLETTMYIVRFKAEFSRWFGGNPDMPKYKRWATQLANELKEQFDEQIIWQRTKEDYIFEKETNR